MISNILISFGIAGISYIIGGICGALYTTLIVMNADKMYKNETGNSFVKWVFDTSNTVKKHRVDVVYAAE